MSDEPTDAEFLLYVEVHAQSERHLFSRDHIRRLMELAGTDKLDITTSTVPGFYGVDSAAAKPLIEKARRKIAEAAAGPRKRRRDADSS